MVFCAAEGVSEGLLVLAFLETFVDALHTSALGWPHNCPTRPQKRSRTPLGKPGRQSVSQSIGLITLEGHKTHGRLSGIHIPILKVRQGLANCSRDRTGWLSRIRCAAGGVQ